MASLGRGVERMCVVKEEKEGRGRIGADRVVG